MTFQWGGLVRSRAKSNALYLDLQKSHEQQTRESADLSSEAATLKATWPFDHVANVRSRDKLKNLYLLFAKTYGY